MRAQRDQFETHHLTCLVCGALPGTPGKIERQDDCHNDM
jgi:hypothetical protein